MNAIKTVSVEVKVSVAVATITHPTQTVKQIANQFGVSETSVKRWKKDFAAQAQEFINNQQAVNESYRGYRARNGRMDIIRSVVREMGVDAKTADLFERANQIAVEIKVREISKSAFYVLVSEVRKEIKANKA